MTTTDPRADALVDAIGRLTFEAMGALTHLAGELDLSLTQLRVLGILRDRRMRMADLADYLGLERSTLSGLVSRAEKRGLVARAPGTGDGRAVDVYLTDVGQQALAAGLRDFAQAMDPLVSRLDEGEGATLLRLLARMFPDESLDR